MCLGHSPVYCYGESRGNFSKVLSNAVGDWLSVHDGKLFESGYEVRSTRMERNAFINRWPTKLGLIKQDLLGKP